MTLPVFPTQTGRKWFLFRELMMIVFSTAALGLNLTNEQTHILKSLPLKLCVCIDKNESGGVKTVVEERNMKRRFLETQLTSSLLTENVI